MLANPGRHVSETGGSPADHRLRAGEQGGLEVDAAKKYMK